MTLKTLELIESTIETPLTNEQAPLALVCNALREEWAEIERLRQAHARWNYGIEQTLGRALGYPRFADDPVNWPEAAAENSPDVCVGDHVAETLAAVIAEKYAALTSRCEWLGQQYQTLCAERQQLQGDKARLLAVAGAFADETVGLEHTEAGKLLMDTIAEFRNNVRR